MIYVKSILKMLEGVDANVMLDAYGDKQYKQKDKADASH
jgi:hypothetical protein